MHDVVFKAATVVDGTGAPARTADVAVSGGRIVEVGRVQETAVEQVDAHGLLLVPGYIDPHTHYDGQATWDPLLRPSTAHGVTTAIVGNCGVGFAPVRPDRHEWLVQLMEGVEDIPGTALHEGIRWDWETFPQYLDALGTLPRVADIAAHLPHSALRTYVMGERGADDEPARTADIAQMASLAEEAARAGAIGFSTNRLPSHTARDGRPVPGTSAGEDELFAIGRAIAAGGGGVIQAVSAEGMGTVPGGYRHDVDWMSRLSIETGLAATLAVTQHNVAPDQWRDVLSWIEAGNDAGARLVAQVPGRPLGLLLGWSTKHQFTGRAAYDEIAGLPLPERVAALRQPDRRRRILEDVTPGASLAHLIGKLADKLFPLDDLDYEPAPESSVAARAGREGRSVDEVCYDLYNVDDGRAFVLFTLGGYAFDNVDHIADMIEHPATMLGLADGGAHCGLICDASVYTSMLSYWTLGRSRGRRLPPEVVVAKMTSIPAYLYGLHDRGVVAPGRRADLNLIDPDRLALLPPRVVDDLPTGATRIVQDATGYVATYVAGVAVSREGADTGARPGRLLRRP